MDICYTEGAEALEQAAAQVEDLKKGRNVEGPPPVPWEQHQTAYDGRFDVLHFEQVPEDVDEDAEDRWNARSERIC